MEYIRYFDLLKAFDYIDISVKSEKTYFISYVRNMFWATILYKYHDLDALLSMGAADILSENSTNIWMMYNIFLNGLYK